MKYAELKSPEIVQRTITALKQNGFAAEFVATAAEAKKRVLQLLPAGAEVMNMTSRTMDQIGVTKEILESGKYQPIRKQFEKLDPQVQGPARKKLGAAPEWSTGSVHAVTETGAVLIASKTGSQLPAAAYGASHVIWVVGTQKIVKDRAEGLKRIYEYCLPLENERARQAYGTAGSSVDKILIINKENEPGRIQLIFVNEVLGF